MWAPGVPGRGEYLSEQPRQRPGRPVGPVAVIGMAVLADERDFAHAGVRQPLDFGEDFVRRPRRLHAARVRHDAKGAELVAAFLHSDEGRYTAAADRGAARRCEVIEFVVDRELGLDRLAVARGARQQIGQAVIALRTHYEIHRRCAADDFLAFSLRDAATLLV